MDAKKLTRNSRNNVIAGICAGLGQYFNVDPVIFRIIFIIFTCTGGLGAIVYIILWVIIPDDSSTYQEQNNVFYQQESYQKNAQAETPMNESPNQEDKKASYNKVNGYIIGVCLMGLGVFFLINNFWHISFSKIWPVFLIAAGLIMIINYFNAIKQNRHEKK
ncbi:MAG: PspC domain-containing protein [Bacteroidales bacterium]|jgi:phage shock protein C|nr:PspC domain-containing protein [Bacteroidales bacterium]